MNAILDLLRYSFSFRSLQYRFLHFNSFYPTTNSSIFPFDCVNENVALRLSLFLTLFLTLSHSLHTPNGTSLSVASCATMLSRLVLCALIVSINQSCVRFEANHSNGFWYVAHWH